MFLSVKTIKFQYTYYLMCERNVKQWYLVIIPCSKKVSIYIEKEIAFDRTVSSGRKMLAKSKL